MASPPAFPPAARRARAVAVLGAASLAACAGAPVAPASPPSKAAAWPERWGIEFALRCRATGEDVRVCVCVANEIQRRWTPEELREREPEALAPELRRCRERLAE